MNFYASHAFLDATAAVYFPGRDCAVENVRIGSDVLRLLVVDGRKVVSKLLFLDYHQPLAASEIEGPVRTGRYAQRVARKVIKADIWDTAKFRNQELAPFIDWNAYHGFADYYEQLLARHHGLVRDRERRGRALAAKHGALTFTFDDRGADVFALAQAWKGRQLREIGFPDFFEIPQTMAFFHALRERGELVSSTLRADGRLVSLWIGFIHDGVWSGWIFAYDPEMRKFSAGHQLLIRMLQESCRLGHREFDFSIGAPDYKMFYATHGRLLSSIGTPPLDKAAAQFARSILIERSPQLFAAALRVKSALGAAMRRTPLAMTAALNLAQ